MLNQIDYIPTELLECPVQQLHEVFPGPTLVHLKGREPRPLFTSVLLHGNEDTGFLATQSVLQKYYRQGLPRSWSIFFGNIEAAQYGVRRLPDRPDYNRLWPGTHQPDTAEARMMARIVDIMAAREVFASVDIHNNSGLNPHYGCVNRLDNRYLQLAALFSRTVVYFLRPEGVQSMAFAAHCPAVTVECGQPGQTHSVEHAAGFLDACLRLTELSDQPAPELDIFHTIARVTVPANVDLSFDDAPADIRFHSNLDQLNFRELPAGTSLGTTRCQSSLPVQARDEDGREVTPEYFGNDNGQLILTKSVMPSMLTLSETSIRQDCLCYLMERITRAC